MCSTTLPFGGSTPVTPKRLNVTDPAARWTAASRERAFFSYSTNYLIDIDHAVIVDVEATTSIRQAEVLAQRRMIERTQERFGLWPEKLVADAAYGAAPNFGWLVEEQGIEPHIPVLDKSARKDDTLARSDFTYDHDDDSYTCPKGHRLKPSLRNFSKPRSLANADGFIRYRAREKDCQHAHSSSAARPTHQPARSCARSMKAHAIWLAISPIPMPILSLAASERRSRCCSRTSNEY